MLKSNLCDYSDLYILAKESIKITGGPEVADAAANRADKRDKKVICKDCAPFTDYIREINNIQVDNAKDLDVVMPMYNLIDYSDDHLKTSGNLWQHFRDKPHDTAITNSELFKSELKITGKTY